MRSPVGSWVGQGWGAVICEKGSARCASPVVSVVVNQIPAVVVNPLSGSNIDNNVVVGEGNRYLVTTTFFAGSVPTLTR